MSFLDLHYLVTDTQFYILIAIQVLSVILILMVAIKTTLHLGIPLSKSKKEHKLIHKKEIFVSKICQAVVELSDAKVGAIITFERNDSLQNWVDLGHKVDATFSSELINAIFNKDAPTHDGAIIIRGTRIACCSTYFPMSTEKLSIKFGSRHRASLQIATLTDAICIVVSEENGKITIASNGKMIPMKNEDLSKILMKEI